MIPHRRSRRRFSVALLGAVAMWPHGAHAMQRVHLRNGFSYDCVQQQRLDGDHVRLFLTTTAPAAPDGNYVDLPATAILSVETVPDPPRPPSPDVPSRANIASTSTLLTHAGSAHDIDVDLLASVVHAESGGRSTAVSRTGAQGLMQLMPGTAHDLGVADAFQPEQNINGGTAYLDHLLTRYHDNLALALAAYNAGPAAVDRYHGIPPFRETEAYVARVMTEFKRRKLALHQTASLAP